MLLASRLLLLGTTRSSTIHSSTLSSPPHRLISTLASTLRPLLHRSPPPHKALPTQSQTLVHPTRLCPCPTPTPTNTPQGLLRPWWNPSVHNPVASLSTTRLILSATAAASFLRHALCQEDETPSHVRRIQAYRRRFLETNHKLSPNNDWLSLLLQTLKPDWPLFLAAVAIALATSLLEIMIPSSVGQLIQIVSSGGHLGSLGLRLCGIFAAQSLLHFLYYSVLSVAAERLNQRLKLLLYESLLVQEIGFFDATASGELLGRLSGDVAEIRGAVKHTITLGIRSLTQIIGGSVSLFFISQPLTLLLSVSLPSMVLFGTFFTWALQDLSRRAQRANAEATAIAAETIANVRTVRAFAAEDKELHRFHDALDRSHALACRFGVGIGIFQGLNMVAVNAVVLLVGWYGGSLISQGHLSQGGMTSFMLHSQSLQHAFKSLSILHGQLMKASGSAQRIFEIIYREPEIPIKDDNMQLVDLKGDIKFDRVLFRYPTRKNTTVLNGLDLHVEPGKVIALVGPSGSGKSTIVGLLERFYEPFAGKITIDGVDIREIDPCSLHKAIGIVTQEPVLFSTSIQDNIRYGNPNATDEEVVEAAKKANAHDFISKFPDSYKTVVGERGALLSGGQKQRIAIARAILKNPSVLILDEATSALDSQNEALVQQALDRLMVGRTVIIVAHRLSTIKNADKIVVMQNGNVVEQGTHDELIKDKEGIYANLVRQQTEKSGL